MSVLHSLSLHSSSSFHVDESVAISKCPERWMALFCVCVCVSAANVRFFFFFFFQNGERGCTVIEDDGLVRESLLRLSVVDSSSNSSSSTAVEPLFFPFPFSLSSRGSLTFDAHRGEERREKSEWEWKRVKRPSLPALCSAAPLSPLSRDTLTVNERWESFPRHSPLLFAENTQEQVVNNQWLVFWFNSLLALLTAAFASRRAH